MDFDQGSPAKQDASEDMVSIDQLYHDWYCEMEPHCIRRKLTAAVGGCQTRIWLPSAEVEHLQLQFTDSGHVLVTVAHSHTQPQLAVLLLPYSRTATGLEISHCSVLKRAMQNVCNRHCTLLHKGELQLTGQGQQLAPPRAA